MGATGRPSQNRLGRPCPIVKWPILGQIPDPDHIINIIIINITNELSQIIEMTKLAQGEERKHILKLEHVRQR